MTELLTAAQMRAIEAAAIASGRVTGLELMERAGRGVVDAIFAEWPELAAGNFRAVVLCGPGGNGGDGFVVARLLHEWGCKTTLHMRDAAKGSPSDATTTRAAYEAAGGITMPMPDPLDRAQARSILGLTDTNLERDEEKWNPVFLDNHAATENSDQNDVSIKHHSDLNESILLVDAMFGTGLTRSIDREDGEICALLHDMSAVIARTGIRLRIVAVDIPSGLCADSGRVLTVEGRDHEDPVMRADMTVTFHGMKLGHMLGEGPQRCGSLRVVDLGLDRSDPKGACHLVDRPEQWSLAKHTGHKFTHGHALILSGSVGHGGAARLAARGALRIGAGVVTVGCPPAALIENAARLDAVMLRPVKDAAGLAEVLADSRINAVCIGPGLGVDRAAAMLGVALGKPSPSQPSQPSQPSPSQTSQPSPSHPSQPSPSHPSPTGEGRHPVFESGAVGGGKALPLSASERGEGRGFDGALVIDADGLTALSRDPDLFALLHANCVLTPHAGEFARLFPDFAARLDAPATTGPAYSKVDATRDAAKRAGCVVLFKGADTVIADPDGRCSINSAAYDRAAPWLATAGSGDVLAGFIAGLLARGFTPMQAAETAAWLHFDCARSFGPGLIAEDISEELPKVFKVLGM